MTPLDTAHAAMEAAPEDDTARLQFYERLADGEMFLLLETEAEGEVLTPKVFDLEDGPVVLIFDAEDRLTAFTGIPAPYAALPGRMIAAHLAGQGIGIGLNLGTAPSSMLLPAEAVDWLAQTILHAPSEVEALPEAFHAPSVPEQLVASLDAKLARALGMAAYALLAGVSYAGGRRGHMLAFVDAPLSAEGALARAASEALIFSGIEAGEMDVTFLSSKDAATAAMTRVGLRFDLPVPEVVEQAEPKAPGSDPDRPPILR